MDISTLKVKRVSSRAEIPTYAHPGEDACFDLRVLIDDDENNPFKFVCNGFRTVVGDRERLLDADDKTIGVWLRPGDSVVFCTGLSFEVEPGYVMKVYARSSTGIKRHLMLTNGVGIIDSGYRGQVHIGLTNASDDDVCVRDGERVAQAEICRIVPVEMIETDTLSDSVRGDAGIGSSGAK